MNYRHTCGHIVRPEDVTPSFDERYAKGKCRFCGKEGVWTATELPTEEQARDAGMAAAAAGTPDWHAVGMRWIERLDLGARITSDDVTRAIGVPASQGAVGALIGAAKKKGLIAYVDRAKSYRKDRHQSGVDLWERV